MLPLDGVELGITSQPSHSKPDLQLSLQEAPGWRSQDMGGHWLSYLSLSLSCKVSSFRGFRNSDDINAWRRGVCAGKVNKNPLMHSLLTSGLSVALYFITWPRTSSTMYTFDSFFGSCHPCKWTVGDLTRVPGSVPF